MNRPITIIGFGSLIWDLDDLATKVSGDWRLGVGPSLPLEFSRISLKRKHSLVVVIDEPHGADCPTHVIDSCRSTIQEAIDDLAARERTRTEHIGWVDLGSDAAASRTPDLPDHIARWCRTNGSRGAVWTDLEANFAVETGKPFSISTGLGYLRSLDGEGAAAAREYINGAPKATDTPLRRALAQEEWW